VGGIRMTQEKIDFLKTVFPKKTYSIPDLMEEFQVSRDTVYYWLEKFETGKIQINATTFITQGSLILMVLKSENKKRVSNIAAALKDSVDLSMVSENPELLNIPISPAKVLTLKKKYGMDEE
jgi:transcriptional antiterminator